MTKKKSVSKPVMKRLTIAVTEEVQKDLSEKALAIGVQPSHFHSMALMLGAQALWRQYNPAEQIPEAAWIVMAEQMGIEVSKLKADFDK